MESKLGLNFDLVEKARTSAANVAADVQGFIDQHTTVTVERAVCRLLGIDGVNEMDVPMPNVLVDHLLATSLLPAGAAWAIGNAMVETGKDPQGVAEAVDSGELDISKLPAHSDSEIRAAITPVVNATVERINKNVAKRNAYLKEWGDKEGPYLYIIVATGNIYEDIIQAKAGAKQGADIIAVIRTTGQSLLDYVPYGATTEGFGGTYATQENFRLMRAALDEVGEEQHRYIRLCNYCSGLCMPEIAAMGALERLDVMLNDALYGILFRDINMQRTIVDQYFSRIINGYAGVIINTGEDNYLTTDDAITAAHTVLASQFLNEAFAKDAGMREEQMGLGHAFEMDPSVENTFLYELAQALVLMACASGCIDLCQLYLGCLQGAVHLVAGAALAPEGAVQAALHLERHFGQAVGGVARHQVVAAGAHAGQARCLVVQRQADGIEQRGLARARGAGDGKQAVARKRRLAKVQRPLAFEGVEVFQSQGEDFHAASASGMCSAASTLR